MSVRKILYPEALRARVPSDSNGLKKREKTGGRQVGTPNKSTIRKQKLLSLRFEQEEMLPHEFLLMVCRGHEIELTPPGYHGKRQYAIPTLQQRIDAANKAAPYYAPRLSTVEVVQGLSDNDLDQIIAGAAAAAGVSITMGPDGQAMIQDLSMSNSAFSAAKDVSGY